MPGLLLTAIISTISSWVDLAVQSMLPAPHHEEVLLSYIHSLHKAAYEHTTTQITKNVYSTYCNKVVSG